MFSSMTEAVTHLSYGSDPPSVFELAGNAVVGHQARLMLQRGLTAVNDTKGTL